MSRDDGERTAGIGEINRRRVLLAVGGASALGAAGHAGAFSGYEQEDGADGNETTNGETDDGQVGQECDPCIDRHSGFLAVTEAADEGGAGAFEAAQTVDLRVTDADVVFSDPDDEGGGPEMGGAGNETAANATADNMTAGNATADNLTAGNATANETDNLTAVTDAEDDDANATAVDAGNETADNETADNETAEDEEMMGPFGEGGFPDFYFDPVGILLEPGDVVAFVTREELHTVTAYHPRFFGTQRRVPEGVPGFTSPPFLENDVWYYRFEEPGVYDMQCLPHESLGMVVRAVVQEADAGDDAVPEAPPDPGEGEMGPSEISMRVLNAPELEPQNIVDQGTVAWEDLTGVESEPPQF